MKISIKKNIFYNVLLQFFNIGFPLFTGSYVSKILGAKNLGVVNYSQIILVWLIVFGTYGAQNYGMREIAKIRDNKEKMSKIFSEIVIIKFIATAIIALLFISLFRYFPLMFSENKLYLITAIALLGNIFDVDWFFFGIEYYKLLSLRNILLKITTFLFIVLFVKKESDYLYYAAILIIGQFGSNFWSFLSSKRFVNFSFNNLNCKFHLPKMAIFFTGNFIVSIYTIFSGIILGMYSPTEKIAFYVRGMMFVNIGISLTGAITTVLSPRASYYYENDKNKYSELLNKSLNYNYIFSIPIVIGLVALGKEINYFFGGEEFFSATSVTILASPLVFIITVGLWSYSQIVIPTGREKFGTIIQGLMAIINLLLTLALVQKFEEKGVVVARLITELFGVVVSLYILNKVIKIKLITRSLWKFVLSAVIMFLFIKLLGKYFTNTKLLLVGFLIGTVSYCSVLIMLKEQNSIEILIAIQKKILEKLKKE